MHLHAYIPVGITCNVDNTYMYLRTDTKPTTNLASCPRVPSFAQRASRREAGGSAMTQVHADNPSWDALPEPGRSRAFKLPNTGKGLVAWRRSGGGGALGGAKGAGSCWATGEGCRELQSRQVLRRSCRSRWWAKGPQLTRVDVG